MTACPPPLRSRRPRAGDSPPRVQLALYLCYELHYRGIAGVSDRWEWNPALLELRGELEARFLGALRADVEPHADVGTALDSLLVEPVHGTGAGPAAVRFYTEHVEADAVHEQLVRREVIGGLLADEPELESDVPERWSPEPP